MRVQIKLSTNGFLFNCLAVLLELSKPFTDPEKPLFNKIDATYLISKHRMDLSKETRVVLPPKPRSVPPSRIPPYDLYPNPPS